MKQWCKILIVLAVFIFCSASLQAEDGNRFTKLDDKGRDLPVDAGQWTMVRDNTTGLTWEVKTTDGTIHDRQNTYGWKDVNEVFIVELNRQKFGGFVDWRLPTTEELRAIWIKGTEPNINLEFFPNTVATGYLSWRRCGSGDIFDDRVKFGTISNTRKDRRVRAVRGGTAGE